MKYIRIGIVAVFLATTIIFAYNWYQDKKSEDVTHPTIQIGSEQIDVSVKEGDEALLKDVIAKDEKDGDLTSSVIVESVSKFIDKKEHICNVTYTVADSDNNVTKKIRKVRYVDYESPKFTLSQPLCFDIGTEQEVTNAIGAVDDRDGDISNKVKILSSKISTATGGEYTVTAQATNSLGDTAKFKTIVTIKQENNLSPIITLKQNIIYLKVGDKFDSRKYISSARDESGKSISKDAVEITKSSVKVEKAGSYMVEYSVKDKQGNEGTAHLAVVVED